MTIQCVNANTMGKPQHKEKNGSKQLVVTKVDKRNKQKWIDETTISIWIIEL